MIKFLKNLFKPKMILYFAYGSNLSEKRMRSRGIKFKKIGVYTLKEFKLVFNAGMKKGDCFANIQYDYNSNVQGVLYEIKYWDAMILDMFEGVPNCYQRGYEIDNYYEYPIMYYIATPWYINNHGRCTDKYLTIIKEGLEENNLSTAMLPKFNAVNVKEYSKN